MRIYLHIGTDKTGSTAIQHSLAQNRAWLLERSVYLPSTGLGVGNGHALLLENMEPAQLAKLRRELHRAASSGYDAALLSWEGMVRFNRARIRLLAKHLLPHDIRVLVYFRDQAEIIQSGHLQWIKMSPKAWPLSIAADPKTSSDKIRAWLFIRDPRRNYYRKLRQWQSCIPSADFSVGIFAPHQLSNADVISDFLQRLGLMEDSEFVRPHHAENPSLSVEAALLVEHWRQQQAKPRQMANLSELAQSLARQAGADSKYFLDECSVNQIRAHFATSNRKLGKSYLGGIVQPFEGAGPCWRNVPFDSIRAHSKELLARVEPAALTAALSRVGVRADPASSLELVSGWAGQEDWWVWSTGEISCLRFRLPRTSLTAAAGIRLILRGHYYGDNKYSRVNINGIDFGPVDLATQSLELSLDALGGLDEVEVTLCHEAPVSPLEYEGSQDTRQLAFALGALEFYPIKNHE